MTNSKKLGIVIAVVALFALCVIACMGCTTIPTLTATDTPKNEVTLVKLSDITIPQHLDQDHLFGLFFFDEEGNLTPYKDGLENCCYDPNKPTIFHVHGQQMGYGYYRFDPFYNPGGVVKAGYNYAVFLWTQLADVAFADAAKPKIWSRDAGVYKYAVEGENGELISVDAEDKLYYATPEVFVAYYLDFMEKANFKGPSITFSGHSLGAQTMFAITSYMTTLCNKGLISRDLLPDSFVYLDAYLNAQVDEKVYIPWLNKTIGEEGLVGLAKDAVDAARKLGCATSYVKSSEFVTFLCDSPAAGGYSGLCKSLHDKMVYLDYDCSYTFNPGVMHNASACFVNCTIDRNVYDTAATESQEFAFNYNTPIVYTYARNGARYFMKANTTEYNFDDDVHYSTNITNAKIAGFAFEDKNNNGINDDRIGARVAGVKVALYDGATLVAETETTEGGYYEFVLDKKYVGKTLTVKVTLPEGYSFGKVSDGDYNNNGINAEGVATVSIVSQMDLKITNIGLNKVK